MEQGNVTVLVDNGNARNSSGSTKTQLSGGRISNGVKIRASELKELFQDKNTACEIFKASFAELIGTAVLIFIGCSGCLGSLGEKPKPIQIAFVFGFTVTLIIQSIGHISDAHINPAITIGSVVLGKKSVTVGLAYIVAQCLGAILGYGLLKIVTPASLIFADNANDTSSFCVTQLNDKIYPFRGLIVELSATAVLMFMCCAVWDNRNERNTDSTAIKFGVVVAILCMAFAPFTGCSLNPARSLGPALWNNSWESHWIYWLGPITGAFIAAVTYRSVFTVQPCSAKHCSTKAEVIPTSIYTYQSITGTP